MQPSARLSSSAALRKVIAGASSATTRSCYRTSRGKAHAAPLPAQEPPPKGQKRATKLQERKARIMEFVENYRASNEGKFPTMRNTREQIGGSSYTVRAVLDEMKYNHAKLHLANPKAPPLQGTVEETEHPTPKDEARVAQLQGMLEVSEHPTPKDEARLAQLQGMLEVSEHSTPKDDAEVAQLQGTVQISEHSTPKDDAEVAQLQGTVQVSEHSFPKDEDAPALSDQTESERMKDLTHGREDNPKLEESANTGLLGSLKSFAYGIRNFWKNM